MISSSAPRPGGKTKADLNPRKVQNNSSSFTWQKEKYCLQIKEQCGKMMQEYSPYPQ